MEAVATVPTGAVHEEDGGGRTVRGGDAATLRLVALRMVRRRRADSHVLAKDTSGKNGELGRLPPGRNTHSLTAGGPSKKKREEALQSDEMPTHIVSRSALPRKYGDKALKDRRTVVKAKRRLWRERGDGVAVDPTTVLSLKKLMSRDRSRP